MKTRKVISPSNFPIRLPLIGTVVWYLMLDKFSAPGWVWGIVGTVIVLFWILAIIDLVNREHVDVIGGKK